jgi:hypothetical protein
MRSGCSGRSERQRARHDPPGELDLEGVVARRTCLRQGGLRSAAEALRIRAEAGQRRLPGSGAPWFGGHSA